MPSLNIAQGIQSGLNFANQREQQQKQREIDALTGALSQGVGTDITQMPEFQQLQALDPQKAQQIQSSKMQQLQSQLGLDDARTKSMFQSAQVARGLLDGSQSRALSFLDQRANSIIDMGGNPSDTLEVRNMIASGDIKGAKDLLDNVIKAGQQAGVLASKKQDKEVAEVSAFNSMIKKAGLNEDEVAKAARIKLGLDHRAMGSADMTLAQKGELKNLVKDMKSEQAQAVEFSKLTGASRSKRIDKAYDTISTINSKLSNYDRAIQLLDEGANVGRVSNLLPSVKAD